MLPCFFAVIPCPPRHFREEPAPCLGRDGNLGASSIGMTLALSRNGDKVANKHGNNAITQTNNGGEKRTSRVVQIKNRNSNLYTFSENGKQLRDSIDFHFNFQSARLPHSS